MSYFKFIWKSNRGFILFSMIFISLFQFMIMYLVTTFDTQSMLTAVVNQLQGNLKMFLNNSFFSMLNFDGAAAFGFNHPIVLALLAIVAINIPVRHISREIENGNMELLLSLPFKRSNLIIKLWISGVLILGVILLVSLAGSVISIQIYHSLSIDIVVNLFKIVFNLWLLYILIMTYTLLIAAISKGGGYSGSIGAMITLIFYLLFFFGQIWKEIAFSLQFNIFNYYQPQQIMFGIGSFFTDCLVLAVLTAVLLFFSLYSFAERDIP